MYKVTSKWPHQDKIKIEWNLGKRCNYDCSYCPSAIHDNHSKHTDIAVLKVTMDKLRDLGKKVRLSFTGGEPTVHPKFVELIDYCNTKDYIEFISVTTNATRTPDFYTNLEVDQFVFSLHFEYDWRRCLDTIIKSTGEYSKKHAYLVHVMAIHDKMQDVKFSVDILELYNIPYAVRRVRWTENEDHDIFDDLRYDQKDLDWILQKSSTVKPNVLVDDTQEYHANDIIKLHLNQYKGWTCNAGLESLMINNDGEVYRATCRVGDSLGNIYEGSFSTNSEPIICTRNYCTCAADIPITKINLSDVSTLEKPQ